jgi:hypothetical protein
MGRTLNATAASGALTVQAFVGDGCTLLAFDLKQGATDKFAGFAIKRTGPDGKSAYLLNFLSFAVKLTQATKEEDVHAAARTTDVAPIQKYRWIDFPSTVNSGDFTYQVETRYFDPDETHLTTRDTVTVAVTLGSRQGTSFHVGFTRGYMSSQAYARKFQNDLEFRPTGAPYLFDSSPYEEKWAWLGYHAREMLFNFLTLARNDDIKSVDAFIYDVDEPDFVKALAEIGRTKTLRVILDDSLDKGSPKADRAQCEAELEPIIGKDNILRTHFKRFAHDKVLILRDGAGHATHVLCGSANFSVRGLYVQGNSIIVVDDPDVAGTYGQAFDDAWSSAASFSAQPIATSWFKFRNKAALPEFCVSFAPHKDGEFALRAPERAVERAKKNVIFALMSPGGGTLISDLKSLASNANVFTFGVLQTEAFATQLIQGGGETKNGTVQNEISSFTPLDSVVPPPFIKEFGGGKGQVIHHKFVVVDFNGENPVVYCGSSNLTSGGEQANGDNMLGIYDREIATLYAIEGIRLADHYRFRDKLKKATDAAPMTLQGPGESPPWYADYYTAGTAKYRSRNTLIQ